MRQVSTLVSEAKLLATGSTEESSVEDRESESSGGTYVELIVNVAIVRSIGPFERHDVFEDVAELLRKFLNELLVGEGELDVSNLVQVLNASQVRPRECTSVEFDDDIEESPEIISSTLILAQVSVGRHVATGADPTRFFAFRSECAVGVDVASRESVINGVHRSQISGATHNEISRLDVAVEKSVVVNSFESF